MKVWTWCLCRSGLILLFIACLPVQALAGETAPPNWGDTAWMPTATALVLFMTIPGLGLFYGSLVRAKNVLSTAALTESLNTKALRTDRFRYVFHQSGRETLYDLTRDPAEYTTPMLLLTSPPCPNTPEAASPEAL